MSVMTLCLDDSGTRQPDRDPGRTPSHGRDWFGLGGIIFKDSDGGSIRARHAEFCQRWQIDYPLHSFHIRNRSSRFGWLGANADVRERFLADLTGFVTGCPITVTACVIDRPGYNARYKERYGDHRWHLCKTAFSIVVERAAKYARANGARLRVFVERSGKHEDRQVQRYYEDLRAVGQPFDPGTSRKYAPLAAKELRETLYEFRLKDKTSPPLQLADLCLWPVCIGGYHPENRSYVAFRSARLLLDQRLSEGDAEACGIKYSCMPR